MSLIVEPVEEKKFDKLSDVKDWISDTDASLVRVPVNGVLEMGGEFVDDEYLGDGETMFRFNDHAMRALCSSIGFRYDQISKLEAPNLATNVLNDLLQQKDIQDRTRDMQFVLDERSMTIIGLVTATYVSYRNTEFLEEIERFLKAVSDDEPTDFQEAYVVNTELSVRFCSTKRHGVIKGIGGRSDDASKIGMEFRNSMVGTSSIRVSYFLHRLACANGMMVPAGKSVNRIHHSGSEDSFQNRLQHRFGELLRKLGSLVEMLETLGTMPFQPRELVSNKEINKLIFEVIPSTRSTICEGENLTLKIPKDATQEEKRKLTLEHEGKIARGIPKYFAKEDSKRIFDSSYRDSATVFDLINVFTEYAKYESVSSRLQIEERAGALAKYIADNKKKF